MFSGIYNLSLLKIWYLDDFSVKEASLASSMTLVAMFEMFSTAREITACSAIDECPNPTTHFSWNSADFSSVNSAAILSKGSADLEHFANVTAFTSGIKLFGKV